jgi:hypothetical protein
MNETYRTKCGTGRASYDPEWDSIRPWKVFVNGAAITHCYSLESAKQKLYEYGCNTREDYSGIGLRKYSKSVAINESKAWNA